MKETGKKENYSKKCHNVLTSFVHICTHLYIRTKLLFKILLHVFGYIFAILMLNTIHQSIYCELNSSLISKTFNKRWSSHPKVIILSNHSLNPQFSTCKAHITSPNRLSILGEFRGLDERLPGAKRQGMCRAWRESSLPLRSGKRRRAGSFQASRVFLSLWKPSTAEQCS